MEGGKNKRASDFQEGCVELQRHVFVCAATDPESYWEERLPAKEQELKDFAKKNGITEYKIDYDRDAKSRFVFISAECVHKVKGMQ